MSLKFNPITGELDLVGSTSSGGTTITTQDEGGTLSSTVTTLNFTGAGVTATGAGATTTINIPGGGGGSLTVTEAEVDFGTTPTTDKLFTITDAGASATSKIIIQASGKPATGRVAGDDQWDSITYSANPGTGSFQVYAKASGSVVGKRNIQYTIN